MKHSELNETTTFTWTRMSIVHALAKDAIETE